MGESVLKKSWGSLITVLLAILLIVVWRVVPFNELLYLVSENIFLVIIFYILIHFVADVLSPIGTSPLFISGFYLMGDWVYLAEFLSAVICSGVNFYLARKWGFKFLSLFLSDKGMTSIKNMLNIFNKAPLIPMRFLTFSFNDVAAYAYGLTKVNFTKYFLMSVFTSAFWLIVWKYLIADTLFHVAIFFVWFYAISIPFFVISFIFYKRNRSKG